MKKTILAIILVLIMAFVFTACANFDFAETDQYIVTAKEALELAENGAVFVDARASEDFDAGHVKGARCIPMSAFMVNEPFKNMLAEKEQIEQVMSASGLTENDTLLIYDDASNMQAARIQWSLNIFSNTNVKVVSGGVSALEKAGAAITTEKPELTEAVYKAGDKARKLVVSLNYVKAEINDPEENTVIIDTRSNEEYNEGTIPGAVHIEYIWNNYANGEYKSSRDIQLTYLDKGLNPDSKIILFCKTSVRAAQTYSALKNAGFKDIRIYDGAWLEYFDSEQPQKPSTDAPAVQGDAS